MAATMLVINNTVFYPQGRGNDSSPPPQSSPLMLPPANKKQDSILNGQIAIINDCPTLGDAIHEPDIFIDKDRSWDFLCVICQCICNTPMDIGCKNGHIYCKLCLKSFFESSTNAKCPQCQDNVNRYSIRINHFALRLLLKLKILCPFNAHNCDDEKQEEYYKCEWIGCYSDIIDHLKEKCKFGTFIHQETIQRVQIKYANKNQIDIGNIDNQQQQQKKENENKSIWEISRAEITSYKVFWEQICESDQHLGNHVNKRSVNSFLRNKLNLAHDDIERLWFLANNDNLISENQFYAAIHIARLHKNKYKPQCNLHSLFSFPHCLTSEYINQIRYNINLSIGSAEKLAKLQEKLQDSVEIDKDRFELIYNKKNEINLDTKIGTMQQLHLIATKAFEGIPKPKRNKNKINNNDQYGIIWNITKQDIQNYRKWFIAADENNDGYIDGREGRKFFVKSKLSQKELAEIWSKVDVKKSGKLTEAQFYAFFHIVLKLKKAKKKLPKNFILPSCLTEQYILQIMNGGQQSRNNYNDDWANNLLWNDQTQSTSNVNTTSNANDIFDTIQQINTTTMHSSSSSGQVRNRLSRNRSLGHNRSDSIDSVHDWGDFTFDF